jgi:hypothetical protein
VKDLVGCVLPFFRFFPRPPTHQLTNSHRIVRSSRTFPHPLPLRPQRTPPSPRRSPRARSASSPTVRLR